MKKYLTSLTLLIATPFMLTSCFHLEVPKITEPKTIVIQVMRWVGNQPVVLITTHCYNQNNLGFTFEGADLNLHIDTLWLGHALVDTSFYVNAHQNFTVPVTLQLDAVRLGQHGLDLSRKVRIRVDGTVKGSKAGISESFPLHYDGMHMIDLRMNYPVNGK